MEQFMAFLPTIIFSILYAIPLYLLARTKGYTSITWIILAVLPVVNLFTMVFMLGLPDKIARGYLAELKALENVA